MENNDKYQEHIKEILSLITKYSNGDFSARSEAIADNDDFDAVMVGLNMLGEELQANVVTVDFLKKILSTLNDIVIAVDSNYEIILANQAASRTLGYSETSLLGNPSRILFAENVFDNFKKNQKSSIKLLHREEVMFFTSEGERILFELSIIPFEWKSENKTGFLCVGYNLQEKNDSINMLILHDKIVRCMVEGLCLISEATGKIFYANNRLDEMFGYNPGELMVENRELTPFPAFSSRDVGSDIAFRVARFGSWSGEISYLKKDGSEIWCSTSVTTFEQADIGTVWLVMHTDITPLKDLQFRLKELSLNDPLTGLRNRRALEEKLTEEWNRGLRGEYSIGVIMIDVDYFKAYNDHYGHPAGDKVLIMISGILKKSVKRAGEMAARYGGEEFIIILPMTDLEETAEFAEHVRSEIENCGLEHEKSHFGKVTISAGVCSLIPKREGLQDTLLNLSDRALYKAKEGGRNIVMSI